MDDPTYREVDLFCWMYWPYFLVCLGYNLLLVIFSTVQAVLIRKLPYNYNESWHICNSTCSTTFMWLLFLPIYFTLNSIKYQRIVLSAGLILSGLIPLFCLFVTRFFGKRYRKVTVAPESSGRGNNSTSFKTLNVPRLLEVPHPLKTPKLAT